ncbi:MAG: hypothetical protein AVDCRST_MAG20-2449, partial [uncultured Acidimicrobiales bacterium]
EARVRGAEVRQPGHRRGRVRRPHAGGAARVPGRLGGRGADDVRPRRPHLARRAACRHLRGGRRRGAPVPGGRHPPPELRPAVTAGAARPGGRGRERRAGVDRPPGPGEPGSPGRHPDERRRPRRLLPVPVPPDGGWGAPGRRAGGDAPRSPRRAAPPAPAVPGRVRRGRGLRVPDRRRAGARRGALPDRPPAPHRARPRRGAGGGRPRSRGRPGARRPALPGVHRAGGRRQGRAHPDPVLRRLQGAPPGAARAGAPRARGRPPGPAPRHRGGRSGHRRREVGGAARRGGAGQPVGVRGVLPRADRGVVGRGARRRQPALRRHQGARRSLLRWVRLRLLRPLRGGARPAPGRRRATPGPRRGRPDLRLGAVPVASGRRPLHGVPRGRPAL